MQNRTPNAPEITSESVYVVYDTKTGRIVHVHTVRNYRGARGSNRKEEEAQVLATAKQFGHKIEELKVLGVSPKDLDLTVPQRVDLKTLRLTRVEAKTKTSSSKTTKKRRTARR